MRPETRALAIGEAVDAAWRRRHGYGRIEVPLSTVATLALIAPAWNETDQASAEIAAMSREAFVAFARLQWDVFVNHRPDLVEPAWPFVAVWLGEQASDDELLGAHEVARAALGAGLLQLTADPGTRRRVDVLGVVLTLLKSSKAAAAQGAYYTPAHVAELLARMGGVERSDSVYEAAVGTGGLLRAAAEVLREHGRDPAEVAWTAVDIDPIAIAALAVNTILWGLGHDVLLGVANVLTEDWEEAARARRFETRRLAADLRRHRTLLLTLGVTSRRAYAGVRT
ncbi:N-6 DNA methylase [Nocardiopsis synnemataformans]|uniref:N-6 DNA methylase n=1 Tax=Nocardiopsis synnemataformans TaxID=61305 RepID=UPI003EBA97CC